jgi:UDP-glucuronate decarboxylase
VNDLIDGMFRMMNNPQAFIGPVNLGNPHEFTILEFAEKVIRLTGSHSKIVFKPLPADDPIQRRPDIELARQKLGWRPAIELEEGLRRRIKYFKSFVTNEPPGVKPCNILG